MYVIKEFKQATKSFLVNELKKKSDIQCIHIIGCGRSGTTMLHYAMSYYNNVYLYDKESIVNSWPSKNFIFHLLLNKYYKTQYYITKRSYGWFKKTYIENLIYYAKLFNIKVIDIIRDPRDVLTSIHSGGNSPDSGKYYISPYRWLMSIKASNIIKSHLEPLNLYLNIRYEDLVSIPDNVNLTLKNYLNLKEKQGLNSFAELKNNINKYNNKLKMNKALNKLRKFDPNSIGKWYKDEEKEKYITELMNSKYGYYLNKIITENGYQQP